MRSQEEMKARMMKKATFIFGSDPLPLSPHGRFQLLEYPKSRHCQPWELVSLENNTPSQDFVLIMQTFKKLLFLRKLKQIKYLKKIMVPLTEENADFQKIVQGCVSVIYLDPMHLKNFA